MSFTAIIYMYAWKQINVMKRLFFFLQVDFTQEADVSVGRWPDLHLQTPLYPSPLSWPAVDWRTLRGPRVFPALYNTRRSCMTQLRKHWRTILRTLKKVWSLLWPVQERSTSIQRLHLVHLRKKVRCHKCMQVLGTSRCPEILFRCFG